MSQSRNILAKKWQQIAYEKHRKRLKETKSKLKGETTLQYNDEEAQLQMRFRRIMAEEKRQAVIDKQNAKLLQRIVDIMTSKKKSFPISEVSGTRTKVNGAFAAGQSRGEKSARAGEQATHWDMTNMACSYPCHLSC